MLGRAFLHCFLAVGLVVFMGELQGREGQILRHASRFRYGIVEKKKLQCQLKSRAAECLAAAVRAFDERATDQTEVLLKEAYANLLQLADMSWSRNNQLAENKMVADEERTRRFINEVRLTYAPSPELQPNLYQFWRSTLNQFVADELCESDDATCSVKLLDDLLQEPTCAHLVTRAGIRGIVANDEELTIPALVKEGCDIFTDYYTVLQTVVQHLDAAFDAYRADNLIATRGMLLHMFATADEYIARVDATFKRCKASYPELIFRGVLGSSFLDSFDTMVKNTGESEENLIKKLGPYIVLCYGAVAAGLPYDEGFERFCKPIIEEWIAPRSPQGFVAQRLADCLRRRILTGALLVDPVRNLDDCRHADDGIWRGVGDAVLAAYRVLSGDNEPGPWQVTSFVVGRDFAPFVGFEVGLQYQKPDQTKMFFLPSRGVTKFRFPLNQLEEGARHFSSGTLLKVEDRRGCLRVLNVIEKPDQDGMVTAKEIFGADPGEEIEVEARLIDIVPFQGTDEERRQELLRVSHISLFTEQNVNQEVVLPQPVPDAKPQGDSLLDSLLHRLKQHEVTA